MTDRRIDRAAWADLINALIDAETRGKKAPFARLVGVDTRTLDRWLTQQVDVSEESVRSVARATRHSAMDMLVTVGYYRSDEVPGLASSESLDPDVLIILRRLADPDTPEAERRTIREMLRYLAGIADREPTAAPTRPQQSKGAS